MPQVLGGKSWAASLGRIEVANRLAPAVFPRLMEWTEPSQVFKISKVAMVGSTCVQDSIRRQLESSLGRICADNAPWPACATRRCFETIIPTTAALR